MTPNLRGKCLLRQNKEELEKTPSLVQNSHNRCDNDSLEITVIHECDLVESLRLPTIHLDAIMRDMDGAFLRF